MFIGSTPNLKHINLNQNMGSLTPHAVEVVAAAFIEFATFLRDLNHVE